MISVRILVYVDKINQIISFNVEIILEKTLDEMNRQHLDNSKSLKNQ